ncbi:MAG: hypothetical protein II724_09015, partial [Clostridia bacterium]|nr:hypothetical protein [Clostridia bacterium]
LFSKHAVAANIVRHAYEVCIVCVSKRSKRRHPDNRAGFASGKLSAYDGPDEQCSSLRQL